MLGFGKPSRPRAVAFDIIGTVFPLEPLRPAVVALGLPAAGLEGWFAAGLRDAFALAAVGDFEPFAKVLEAALDGVLAEQGLSPPAGAKTALLTQMEHLPPRPDASEAFKLLRDNGIGVLALTNGSHSSTKSLLNGGGLDGLVDDIVSVDDVKLSKPRAEVYLHAAVSAKVAVGDLALIAAHAWDIDGAKAAGLTAVYLSADRPFSRVMRNPDLEAATLLAAAEALVRL